MAERVADMAVEVKGLASFVKHIGAVSAEAKKLDETVVTGIALDAKRTVVAAASPHHLSRFADGQGIDLGARFIVKPGEIPTAILFPTPPGPWYLLEKGSYKKPSGYMIGNRVGGVGVTKSGRARRGKRNQSGGFLGRPGVFAAVAPVHHDPIAPKHTWDKAAAAAVARGDRTFKRETRQAYLKMFAG